MAYKGLSPQRVLRSMWILWVHSRQATTYLGLLHLVTFWLCLPIFLMRMTERKSLVPLFRHARELHSVQKYILYHGKMMNLLQMLSLFMVMSTIRQRITLLHMRLSQEVAMQADSGRLVTNLCITLYLLRI
uniref:Uncharacterized protein n=1 Tax=Arundo donax TaxID=35708 RepID=A0A0A9DWN7_ARUDO